MHMLSAHNRSEFLAVPQLIRFDYAQGSDGFEPTLLIKGSTLLLKYIVRGAQMQLAFTMCGGRLLYALKICDDGSNGCIVWSIVEREEELNGIRGMARGEPLVAFIFNELAVNVTWNDLSVPGKLDRLSMWTSIAALGPIDHSAITVTAFPLLDRLHLHGEGWLLLEVGGRTDWKILQNHFITAGASSSLINLFDDDEGNQQEQLGIWLTDNLQLSGVHHSPQIPKGNGTRELTDILLSHEFGAILIESKTLSVLAREKLPDRTKLKRDISIHIDKAFAQLRGAIRALKSGVPVTSPKGNTLSIERERPTHAVVLIPDLNLVDDHSAYGIEFMHDFMGATGGFVHLLDISELLRIVQAAEMIVERSTAVTPMMAFDYYLMERAEKAREVGTLRVEVLLRFVDDGTATS